jgi:hypothetical protein
MGRLPVTKGLGWWHLEILRTLNEETGFSSHHLGDKIWPNLHRVSASGSARENCQELERRNLVRRFNALRPIGWCRTKEGTQALMDLTRTHFYRDVPGLGNVAVSRHAQASMITDKITQQAFDKALLSLTRPDVPDGPEIVWRERDGLRIVILTNPTPNNRAKLVKAVYRVERPRRPMCGKSEPGV